jgi:hypothetical protein
MFGCLMWLHIIIQLFLVVDEIRKKSDMEEFDYFKLLMH